MKIVLTGFGPFGSHSTNASWQAVQGVPQLLENSEEKDDLELHIEEVPVCYSFVQAQVPEKWAPFDFVIHVGVSSIAECIQLETCANNQGYCRVDVENQVPADMKCVNSKEDHTLSTCLNVDQVIKDLNGKSEGKLRFEKSDDAGRYLCEFIYYASLSKTDCKTLFVHVPPLDNPYSQEELSRGLFILICKIVENIRKGNLHHHLEGDSQMKA